MDWELTKLDKLCTLLILAAVIPSTAQELCSETKKWCENGYCCNYGQCCLYYHETWWFWLIWGVIFLIASCCFYQRDKLFRCWRPSRRRNLLIASPAHPYQNINSTSIVPIYDPNVRLPSYDEVPVLPKGPPPEYNQVYCSPVLQVPPVNIGLTNREETDWEVPEGIPPPPYSPQV